MLLVTNCISELYLRIKTAEDSEQNIHASEIFGPVCLLISFILAFVLTIVDKVCELICKLEYGHVIE